MFYVSQKNWANNQFDLFEEHGYSKEHYGTIEVTTLNSHVIISELVSKYNKSLMNSEIDLIIKIYDLKYEDNIIKDCLKVFFGNDIVTFYLKIDECEYSAFGTLIYNAFDEVYNYFTNCHDKSKIIVCKYIEDLMNNTNDVKYESVKDGYVYVTIEDIHYYNAYEGDVDYINNYCFNYLTKIFNEYHECSIMKNVLFTNIQIVPMDKLAIGDFINTCRYFNIDRHEFLSKWKKEKFIPLPSKTPRVTSIYILAKFLANNSADVVKNIFKAFDSNDYDLLVNTFKELGLNI